ncbi:MAG: hypothetical protein H0W88_10195 [Parachlamydiaceae bacterium]|nr:hypothetical protein [Parachlamydiaceae bacterium]
MAALSAFYLNIHTEEKFKRVFHSIFNDTTVITPVERYQLARILIVGGGAPEGIHYKTPIAIDAIKKIIISVKKESLVNLDISQLNLFSPTELILNNLENNPLELAKNSLVIDGMD